MIVRDDRGGMWPASVLRSRKPHPRMEYKGRVRDWMVFQRVCPTYPVYYVYLLQGELWPAPAKD